MEEQGYIELRVTNKDNSLSPKDIDINEVKDFISDVETFLYPNRKEKQNRPHISYEVSTFPMMMSRRLAGGAAHRRATSGGGGWPAKMESM